MSDRRGTELYPLAYTTDDDSSAEFISMAISRLLGVSSGCAQPITGQVTLATWPVIG